MYDGICQTVSEKMLIDAAGNPDARRLERINDVDMNGLRIGNLPAKPRLRHNPA